MGRAHGGPFGGSEPLLRGVEEPLEKQAGWGLAGQQGDQFLTRRSGAELDGVERLDALRCEGDGDGTGDVREVIRGVAGQVPDRRGGEVAWWSLGDQQVAPRRQRPHRLARHRADSPARQKPPGLVPGAQRQADRPGGRDGQAHRHVVGGDQGEGLRPAGVAVVTLSRHRQAHHRVGRGGRVQKCSHPPESGLCQQHGHHQRQPGMIPSYAPASPDGAL
jgi:hypothetical protein